MQAQPTLFSPTFTLSRQILPAHQTSLNQNMLSRRKAPLAPDSYCSRIVVSIKAGRLVPSRYLIVFWDERRLGITRLRRARGLMGREEGKIATGRFRSNMAAREESSLSRYFSFFPSHETPRAPQRNPQSSLIPKNN